MDKPFESGRMLDFQTDQPLSTGNNSSHSEDVISYESDGHGHRHHDQCADSSTHDPHSYNLSLRTIHGGPQFLPFEDRPFNNYSHRNPISAAEYLSNPGSSEADPANTFRELMNPTIGSYPDRELGSIARLYDNQNGGRWASDLLLECAKAISQKEMSRVQQLLWMLNELASPYGDCDQRLASYFLQAFFCKVTETGPRRYRTLCSAGERRYSFDSMRKITLKFQEGSPWTTFGHVAANGAILEAMDGESNLHIVDMSNTFCTQWPTLLESLATRNEGTPNLRLTTVQFLAPNDPQNIANSSANLMMNEIAQRMEKFARLMGVPFEFKVVHLDIKLASNGINNLSTAIQIRKHEALAINCVHSLQRLPANSRGSVLSMFFAMKPKIVTVVEDEVDLVTSGRDFVACFSECHRFFSLFFESLEESFPGTSNERLTLERGSARSMVNILACDDGDSEIFEQREKAVQWGLRMKEAGFEPWAFTDDVLDDVRALLKRYKEGWGFSAANSEGFFLTWKEQPAIWASAWKPNLEFDF